ncbi:MAG: polyphosphate kinase 2, partial [Bacteroidota bacterium]
DRRKSPLKQWKLSPVDEKAQKKWDAFTEYKNKMLNTSHTNFSPWIIVEANDKKKARLESIRYVLSQMDYPEKEKAEVSLLYNPKVIIPYYRAYEHLDR